MNSMSPITDLDLRRAGLCQLLHWLAVGRVQPQALVDAYQAAIERINPQPLPPRRRPRSHRRYSRGGAGCG